MISIIIVLYNALPKSYIYEITENPIIIVDNTPNRDLNISSGNIKYIPLYENMGIAKALNVGIKAAIEYGSEWVLTMDQDSELPSNMIMDYTEFILNHSKLNIGLLAPLINMYYGEDKKPSDTYLQIDEAITSGSLVNVEAFNTIGGFKEELFIDGVDFEFCWNLKRHGYSLYQLNNVVMQHQLGETREYKLCGIHLFYVTNHNYIRRYYMTRNTLYIQYKYHDIMPKAFMPLISKIVTLGKIIFFENDVLRKLKARRLGMIDFKNSKFGKFDYNL